MSETTERTTETVAAPTATSDVILEAAFRILARDGYQGLTARSVAEEAGTNLALVNYYFGGKKGLLLALYDRLERQRFDRQQTLYTEDEEPLSVKWRRAVEYYRRDLVDGFVRVHHELQAQGFADEALAARGRKRVISWGELLTEVAENHLPELGVELPAARVAMVLSAFWYGMEQLHLIGISEADVPYFAILEDIGDWLEKRERSG